MRRRVYNFEGPESVGVAEYIKTLNETLVQSPGRIVGEIVNLKLYEGRNYLFFSIKDKEAEALLNCFMWKRDYTLSGTEIVDGLEVVIDGYPKIFEPSGSLTFQTEMIELVGEGALKAAYDKLKLKLEKEGLFAEERKRQVPVYPQKIGIITSRDGAVLSDFQSNIGHFGYEMLFVNSKVEGQAAIKDLLSAVKTLRKKDLDVLVVMRGGGSLESFAAFNNELLVREITNFPVPVIAGIGHDKDVPLVAMASDVMVSTPTAAAAHLNASWDQALSKVRLIERQLVGNFAEVLSGKELYIVRAASLIRENFTKFLEKFREIEHVFGQSVQRIGYSLRDMRSDIQKCRSELERGFKDSVSRIKLSLVQSERELNFNDPNRQLRLGYSIVRVDGKIITNTKTVHVGEMLDVQTHDGTFDAEIKNIRN